MHTTNCIRVCVNDLHLICRLCDVGDKLCECHEHVRLSKVIIGGVFNANILLPDTLTVGSMGSDDVTAPSALDNEIKDLIDELNKVALQDPSVVNAAKHVIAKHKSDKNLEKAEEDEKS
jgi:hypothetical protein